MKKSILLPCRVLLLQTIFETMFIDGFVWFSLVYLEVVSYSQNLKLFRYFSSKAQKTWLARILNSPVKNNDN